MNFTQEQLDKIVASGQFSIVGDTAVHTVNKAVRVQDWTAPPSLEDTAASVLAEFCAEWKFPLPEREYRFEPSRRWRFDFAWPDMLIAVEVEGGTRHQGRHNRHEGFENDCEKYNHAALVYGWYVLRFTSDMVKDGRMAATMRLLPPF